MLLDKSQEIKFLKKVVSKHPTIDVKNVYVDGVVTINNIRRYRYPNLKDTFTCKVEVTYTGLLQFKYRGHSEKKWYDSNCDRRGNRITNKLIRKGIYDDVKRYLSYFGIDIQTGDHIVKVIWK